MSQVDIDNRLRVLTVIWISMSMGVLVFAFVAYGLVVGGSMDPPALDSSVVTMVAPLLLVLMAGGLVIGRRMEAAIPRGAPVPERINRYQSARIVSLALQEGPALAVIALGMVSAATAWILAAGLLGVWSMFLSRPRREDLEALLRD